MKAITIWQPWASLLACGAKKFETRSWATDYRGPIAIHAAKKDIYKTVSELPDFTTLAVLNDLYWFWNIQDGAQKKMAGMQGCVIATAELVGCYEVGENPFTLEPFVSNDNATAITGNELLFGNWQPGRYAWEFANMQMLEEPIPAKGRQRMWNWEDMRNE